MVFSTVLSLITYLMSIAVIVKMEMNVSVSLMGVRVNMHMLTVTQGEIQNAAAQKNDHQRNREFKNAGNRVGNGKPQYDHQQSSNQE